MKTLSGKYVYLLNSQPTGVSETFCRESDSAVITTKSTRDASVFGSTISVETEEKDGQFTIADIRFSGQDIVSAEYQAFEGGFHFTRSINGDTIDRRDTSATKGTILFPLMRVFQGPTILEVAANNSETNVLVPFIENTFDTSRLLTPTFDKRSAKQIGTDGDIRIFNYRSKHYDDASEFHINREGLLVYYRFPQTPEKIWEVRLENLQTAPKPFDQTAR